MFAMKPSVKSSSGTAMFVEQDEELKPTSNLVWDKSRDTETRNKVKLHILVIKKRNRLDKDWKI